MAPRRRNELNYIRACADLVRLFGDDHRLETRTLLANLAMHAVRSDGAATDFVDTIGRAVSDLLNKLTPRQREILTRCDINGENANAAARRLYISRRHLFRERRQALQFMADELVVSVPKTSGAITRTSDDHFNQELRLAKLLQDRGAWRDAADILERLAESLDDAEQRGFVENLLSRLYSRSDRLALARHHATIAKELAARVRVGKAWHLAEADVARALVEYNAHNIAETERLAVGSATVLRSWLSTGSNMRVQNAFAEAILLQHELAFARGDITLARGLIEEAIDLTERAPSLESRLQILIRACAALLEIYCGQSQSHEEAITRAYQEALSLNLVDEACGIAGMLAASYRFRGQSHKAMELLTPLTPLANFAPWDGRARVIYELVNASIELGDLALAQTHLDTLTEISSGSVTRLAAAQFTAARFYLASRLYDRALVAAEEAETIYDQLRLPRLVGEALLLQSKALVAGGKISRARLVMARSIDVMSATMRGKRLGEAYTLMAKVTGQPKYAVAARRELRARPQEPKRG